MSASDGCGRSKPSDISRSKSDELSFWVAGNSELPQQVVTHRSMRGM